MGYILKRNAENDAVNDKCNGNIAEEGLYCIINTAYGILVAERQRLVQSCAPPIPLSSNVTYDRNCAIETVIPYASEPNEPISIRGMMIPQAVVTSWLISVVTIFSFRFSSVDLIFNSVKAAWQPPPALFFPFLKAVRFRGT